MDLGGKDITSVQYQNANNSVRVNDAFMRAVQDGTEFGLTSRMDGSVIETVDARELMGKIAKAAWECADPGIQYDDTINDWHTNPETGRITASNPCSEYMSLDNSSCNLASLNLLKFLKDDDTFDAVTFQKVVELVITAMDISICFADFPTESIGATTRDYRQLGIGYANLGALLMATGHGYDSDGGRALSPRRSPRCSPAPPTSAPPSSPRSSARTPATPATRTPTSASCASTPPPTTRSAPSHDGQGHPPGRHEGLGRRRQARRRTATATRRPPCSRRPGPSAS